MSDNPGRDTPFEEMRMTDEVRMDQAQADAQLLADLRRGWWLQCTSTPTSVGMTGYSRIPGEAAGRIEALTAERGTALKSLGDAQSALLHEGCRSGGIEDQRDAALAERDAAIVLMNEMSIERGRKLADALAEVERLRESREANLEIMDGRLEEIATLRRKARKWKLRAKEARSGVVTTTNAVLAEMSDALRNEALEEAQQVIRLRVKDYNPASAVLEWVIAIEALKRPRSGSERAQEEAADRIESFSGAKIDGDLLPWPRNPIASDIDAVRQRGVGGSDTPGRDTLAAITAERDRAEGLRATTQEQFDRAIKQRDEFIAERDTALAERDAAIVLMNEMSIERGRKLADALAEVERLKRDLQDADCDTDTAKMSFHAARNEALEEAAKMLDGWAEGYGRHSDKLDRDGEDLIASLNVQEAMCFAASDGIRDLKRPQPATERAQEADTPPETGRGSTEPEKAVSGPLCDVCGWHVPFVVQAIREAEAESTAHSCKPLAPEHADGDTVAMEGPDKGKTKAVWTLDDGLDFMNEMLRREFDAAGLPDTDTPNPIAPDQWPGMTIGNSEGHCWPLCSVCGKPCIPEPYVRIGPQKAAHVGCRKPLAGHDAGVPHDADECAQAWVKENVFPVLSAACAPGTPYSTTTADWPADVSTTTGVPGTGLFTGREF